MLAMRPDVIPQEEQAGSATLKVERLRGAWVAQSVERLTLARVMILRFVGSSPASGCVLTASSSPEPASDSVSPSVSVPPPLTLCLSLKNK